MIRKESLEYLRGLAEAVVEASRVKTGQRVGDSPANSTGGTLIRPGGRACYPAYWVRDFVMSLDAGFVSLDEVRHHLQVTVKTQNGAAIRKLRGGAAVVPAWAVVDHMNFDGGAVFYPGTMSAGEDQGGEPFGIRPPECDHFYFVEAAHYLWRQTRDAKFLGEEIGGTRLMERLWKAMGVPDAEEETGAVMTTAENRAVGFGFYDCVYLTGAMLFPTLLRWRAAGMLAELAGAADDENMAVSCYAMAKKIRERLVGVFGQKDSGWLLAATGVGRQSDVWGTIYALHLGILEGEVEERARREVAASVRKGTIVHRAGVRHIPTDQDHSPESAWEQVVPGVKRGTYQNGAYWHTATGWLVSALWEGERELATRIAEEYVAVLKEEDFRKGELFGGPWECFGVNGAAKQNAVYMASVTAPYAVLRDLKE